VSAANRSGPAETLECGNNLDSGTQLEPAVRELSAERPWDTFPFPPPCHPGFGNFCPEPRRCGQGKALLPRRVWNPMF